MVCPYNTRLVAQIAQSVEQGIENPRVGGSIPPLGTTAGVVELVDTLDLGSSAARRESSSLSSRTK